RLLLAPDSQLSWREVQIELPSIAGEDRFGRFNPRKCRNVQVRPTDRIEVVELTELGKERLPLFAEPVVTVLRGVGAWEFQDHRVEALRGVDKSGAGAFVQTQGPHLAIAQLEERILVEAVVLATDARLPFRDHIGIERRVVGDTPSLHVGTGD